MKYLALYRKYRPSKFEEIAGQDNVVSVLKNAVKNNKISHAYLFCGPRGTGKTTTAKILAKMVNCLNPIDGEPCGKCDICVNSLKNLNEDIIEIDAASNNGVDEIRELRDKINLVPVNSKYKVYIIDEVHMLTTGAFNALLKTLEEPPKHVIFVLATTEMYKIPLTISSRCQKFKFDKITVDNIVKRLNEICNTEKIKIDEGILKEIARIADGGMRDAINLLDQLVSYKGENININDVYDIGGIVSFEVINEMLVEIYNHNVNKFIEILDEIDKSGKSIDKFIEEIIIFLKDVLIYNNTTNYDFVEQKKEKIKEVSKMCDDEIIYLWIDELNKTLNNIKFSSYPMILLEITLIKLSNMLKKSDPVEKKEVNKSVDNLQNTVKLEKNKDTELHNNDIINKKPTIKENDEIADLKKVRINNTFVDANKNLLNEFKNKFTKINDYSTDSKYEMIVGLLKDVEIVVVGTENLIFTSKFNSISMRLNENLDLISELFEKICNANYKPIFLTNNEWNEEKKKYICNINNGYLYVKQEEKVKKVNKIKNKKNNELVDILGEELIEYK